MIRFSVKASPKDGISYSLNVSQPQTDKSSYFKKF